MSKSLKDFEAGQLIKITDTGSGVGNRFSKGSITEIDSVGTTFLYSKGYAIRPDQVTEPSFWDTVVYKIKSLFN